MDPIRLELLGKCSLHVGEEDRTVGLRRTGKGTGLLTLLCLKEGGSYDPLYLQEILWPESKNLKNRATNYRQQISRLRLALGKSNAALIVTRREVRLDMDYVQSDLNTFLNHWNQKNWQEAVNAYGGQLLPGIGDAWADEAREKLIQQFVDACAALVEKQKLARPEEALNTLERWRTEVPESEEPLRLRWEILVTLNRAPQALTEAEEYCMQNPHADSETRSWLERLQKPPLLGEVPPLPASWTSFVGRQEELAQLVGRVLSSRLFTLCGEGGMGKTRLALELANRLYEEFEQQVVFIDLSQLPVGASVSAIRALLEQTLKTSITDLSRARALLVLDNAEHVLPAIRSIVQELIAGGQQLQLLITSRQELGYRHERKLRLSGLLADDARELFLQVSPALENLRKPEEKAALERLCKRLDGWPLAIELVASRREAFDSLHKLEQNLEQALVEAGTAADDPTVSPRELTLHTTMDWSARLLDEEARRIWYACPSFVGGISPEALAGVAGQPVGTVEKILLQLSVVSLIRQEDRRYRVLEPVRAYLRPKETVQRAFASYFLGLAEEKASAEVLLMERANLAAAGEWLLEHSPEEALRLTVALWRFWWEHGDMPQGLLLISRALETVKEHTLRTEALLGAGALAYGLRLQEPANAFAQEALERAQAAGDPMLEARAWLNWGLAALIPKNRSVGDATVAKERFQRAEPLFASGESERGVRLARSNQLYAAMIAGEPGVAERYEKTLSEFDASGDIDGWLTEANNLIYFFGTNNRKSETIPYLREAVRRAHAYSQRRMLLQAFQGVTVSLSEADSAWLFGALDRLKLDWGLPLVAEAVGSEQVRRWHCEAVLGTDAWNAALQEGAALSEEAIVQRVLQALDAL